MNKKCLICFLVVMLFFFLNIPVTALEVTTSGNEDTNLPEISESTTPEEVDAILARLSDEEIRGLLISELKRSLVVKEIAERKGLFQRLDQESGKFSNRLASVVKNIPNVPFDFLKSLDNLKAVGSKNGGMSTARLFGVVLILVLFYFIAYGVELLFRRLTNLLRDKLVSSLEKDGIYKIWNAVINFLLDILNIVVFSFSSLLIYFLILGPSKGPNRLLFVVSFLVILLSRTLITLSNIFFSPQISRLRLINVSDRAAEIFQRNIVTVILLSVIVYSSTKLLVILKMPHDSRIIITVAIGTILFIVLGNIILKYRSEVSKVLLEGSPGRDTHGGDSWFKTQFANTWHIYALTYLILLWLFTVGRMILIEKSGSAGGFYLSLLIVPIYLILDRIGQWLIESTMGIIVKPKASTSNEEVTQDGESGEEAVKHEYGRYISIARNILRIGIIFILFVWLLGTWGIEIPFIAKMGRIVFDIFITLVMAHIAWSVSTKIISRKLQETGYNADKDPTTEDDEWGAAEAERSHTLLPLARKFIGAVLVTMVVMTIISSIGVNIGPLLAGAGIVGLAIGFGAQKLVSDIFSGFFLLIDDAFRVGEYIQGSGVAGTVEGITLRMVKLRHHRGMLQFVPYSDLGTITNFMRGGMVVKFNLQLPYDTDINKVRKIIKKVGKKMLADEQFADDFIKPIKSQGVKSVGDSVMTIRVKFTAKPGKQFMIRREAFRLITEDLAAKGIHYAHRKVIVEIPSKTSDSTIEKNEKNTGPAQEVDDSSTSKDKAIEAGAAAGLDTILTEEGTEKKDK